MKYIDVLGDFAPSRQSSFDSTPFVMKQSDGILISLKKGVQKRQLLNGHYHHTPEKIREFKKRHSAAGKLKLWMDSGGYDFLKSTKVDQEYMQAYLGYYLSYLRNYKSDYHRVFSLDFQPAIRKDNLWFNTKNNIIEWNQRSLSATVELVKANRKLGKKLYFVQHSKTRSLYDIWRKLNSELDLQKIVQNRAVGGLVSAHELSRKGTSKVLLFSPVIGPAYRAFNDYLKARKYHNNFTLHFLGVSNKIDRFVISVIEYLFAEYLKEIGLKGKVRFTYDTRAYSKNANTQARSSEIFIYSKKKHDRPIRLPDPTLVSHESLSEIYHEKIAFKAIVDDIENTIWDDKLNSTEHYYPLFIWSNRNLDNYFKAFVKEHSIAEIVKDSKNSSELIDKITRILIKLVPSIEILKSKKEYKDHKYEENIRSPLYDIWTPDMIKKIIGSLEQIYLFNDWLYNKDCDEKVLDDLMLKFIEDMGINDPLA